MLYTSNHRALLTMRATLTFLVCGTLLLGYCGRTVWQCYLSIALVLYHICTNGYILMLVLISSALMAAVHWCQRRLEKGH